MPGRWRIWRLAGLVAALVMGGGMGGLAAPVAASAAAACPAWDGTQPADPLGASKDHDLLAVAVAGACDVWVVRGQATSFDEVGRTLIEHWTGGSSWTVMPSPGPTDSGGSNAFEGVAAVSPANIWAVGVQTLPGQGLEGGLVAHWDGTSWTQVPVPDATTDLTSITAVSASDMWAAGPGFARNADPVLLHYDGTRWSRSPVPAITPFPGPGETRVISISGVTATSASDAWAVGTVEIGLTQATP